jgi:WhiB family redox-sensing transcriptional regulator
MTLVADLERTEAEHAWYHALLSDLDPPTLEELAVRPAWQTLAACRGMGPDRFFPELGESAAPARDICAGCGVLTECLEYAMASESGAAGIWAGTSERGRRQLRRASA